MTPTEYIAHIAALLAESRYTETLEYAERTLAAVAPPLTMPERERVYGLVEIAATLLDLEQAEATSATWRSTPSRGRHAARSRASGG